jgi:hypothetical protein
MWATIDGFPYYLISSTGEVKSIERKVKMPMGGFRICNEKILKPRIGPHGYYYVNLCSDTKRSECIHRLVATAFVPNPENKKCVNHKDGNKLNNVVSNLEWATHSENNQHAYDNGLKVGAALGKTGALSSSSKIVGQFSMNGDLIKTYPCQREASRQTGILQGNISAVCNNRQKSAGGYIWRNM